MGARIEIDGADRDVPAGQNVLEACLSLGYDLPYFCWHPALGSVGACRQCAVKQFHGSEDRHGRIVMACMTPAVDGTRIAIADPEAVAFRAGVVEWLMSNHPHDCPVCEEGGECHLQDMTVMTGHTYRRYRFTKRTHRNQDLGPFLTHEMNRCIACYRCARFYRDYAGGRDFAVFASHRNVYFGRDKDGPLENEFSGNLAEICPTGVFDDKPFGQHFNRKWDLRGTPSLCVHCGLGCNTIANERFGALRRIVNRYNGAVNGYFLCDRGRFGGAFVNSDSRIRSPLLREPGGPVRPVSKGEALRHASSLLGGQVIGIGSPRASLEANFALRALVGPEHFYLGLSESDHRLLALTLDILRDGPARAASLADAEQADGILVLGEDVPNTAPRLALSLRQAVRQKGFAIAERLKIPRWQDLSVREVARAERSPLFIATPDETRLDDVAARAVRAAPDDVARLGFAVAHAIDPTAPAVPGLTAEEAALAAQVAQALTGVERPLIVAGYGCGQPTILQAAANVAWALCRKGHPARLCLTVPECNSLGLALIGGGRLADALTAMAAGSVETLIILENDLYHRVDRASLEQCLPKLRHLVVIDHSTNETTRAAELVLPAGTFADSDGTLVSNEGRAQRYFQLLVSEDDVQESWRWLRDLAQAGGRSANTPWNRLDDLTTACAAAIPGLWPIRDAAPNADFRVGGSKLAREPHRYSGRTALHAAQTVHEPKPPDDPDTPLTFTMEGYYGAEPPAALPYFWAPSWNSVQSVNKFQQEIGGPLRGGDPGVRLIEPDPARPPPYYQAVPPAFASRQAAFLLLPMHDVFGSDELARRAPAVALRVPPACLALNPEDASMIGAKEGTLVAVTVGEVLLELPVRLRPELVCGLAGIAAWASPGATFPAWGTVALLTKVPPHG